MRASANANGFVLFTSPVTSICVSSALPLWLYVTSWPVTAVSYVVSFSASSTELFQISTLPTPSVFVPLIVISFSAPLGKASVMLSPSPIVMLFKLLRGWRSYIPSFILMTSSASVLDELRLNVTTPTPVSFFNVRYTIGSQTA